ncbi:peroxisomal leader peptide-processing protease isoform X2 [Melopsittacus undulatus]|uniref:peroxisomal leader peptide-processing protease isoform X2 n=1 Tax=Melopsittacus undulatus TaxID=13146 RepID=UPI00146B72C6|nr:peroxisomal leader peptide-processing protease isoform X2 [Melopsittacus undulatus]
MAEERVCCVVSVSSQTDGSWSCSGVVLSRGPALVLCQGAVFTPFLRDGPTAWSQPRALLPAALRPCPRILVLQPPAGTRVPALGLDAPSGGLQQHEAGLLALVPCAAFQQALGRAFGPAEQWRFGGEAAGDDPRALHWFAWLRVPGLDTPGEGWTARASASCLRKGEGLLACGSPFGDLCPDLFLNTLSRGVVSNLAGEENALILTDARCLPGTEGGGAFLPSPDGSRLVAVITASFCWKGAEWVGLTLLCSLAAILSSSASILGEAGVVVPPVPGRVAAVPAGSGQDPLGWVALVECGASWGSGVLLAPRLLLTCRHVVEAGVLLRVMPAPGPGRPATTLNGRVIFTTEESSPFDVAVVELEESVPSFIPPCPADSFLPGIVASNTRDTGVGSTYPHLNFCIPITILQPPIAHYQHTGDPAAFAGLNGASEGVQAAWRLQRQPGLPSKL